MKIIAKILSVFLIMVTTSKVQAFWSERPGWLDQRPAGNYRYNDLSGRTYHVSIESTQESIQYHICMVDPIRLESAVSVSSGWQDIPRARFTHSRNLGVWIQTDGGVFPGSSDGHRHMGITWDENGQLRMGFSLEKYLLIDDDVVNWYELEPSTSNPCEGLSQIDSEEAVESTP